MEDSGGSLRDAEFRGDARSRYYAEPRALLLPQCFHGDRDARGAALIEKDGIAHLLAMAIAAIGLAVASVVAITLVKAVRTCLFGGVVR